MGWKGGCIRREGSKDTRRTETKKGKNSTTTNPTPTPSPTSVSKKITMTRSRTKAQDPLKGFRFEPEFIPNEGVVDVWRHLSDQVPDLEIRIRELREQGIEVFEDVERDGETTSPTGKTIYDFYNVSDKQRLNRLVEVFTRNLDESQKKWIEMSVIMGIESCIENVFQHADRDQEFLGVKRGLSTEKPYARALVAVQMWLYGHVDFYCLDNGKGF